MNQPWNYPLGAAFGLAPRSVAKEVKSVANPNVATQVHELKWAAQETKHRRTDCPVTAQSVHVQETERLKQEGRAGDRAEVASALDALK